MKTILLTFTDEQERDKYLEVLRTISAYMVNQSGAEEPQQNGALLQRVLDTVKFDPPIKTDAERFVALFVAGQKMAEGSLVAMNKQFDQEITQHSGSVQIREQRNGAWTTIRQRPRR